MFEGSRAGELHQPLLFTKQAESVKLKFSSRTNSTVCRTFNTPVTEKEAESKKRTLSPEFYTLKMQGIDQVAK